MHRLRSTLFNFKRVFLRVAYTQTRISESQNPCKLVYYGRTLAGELGFEPRLMVLETTSLAISRFPYMAEEERFELSHPFGSSALAVHPLRPLEYPSINLR